MWFVSVKKYNKLKQENETLQEELKRVRIQLGAVALLYREEIDAKTILYRESTNKK